MKEIRKGFSLILLVILISLLGIKDVAWADQRDSMKVTKVLQVENEEGCYAGKWFKYEGNEEVKWKYLDMDREVLDFVSSSWQLINDRWYYFDSEGWMYTGWLLDDNNWYYLDDVNGHMITNEWRLSGGYWYYLGSDGKMLKDCVTPDGYRVNEDGVWIKEDEQKNENWQWIDDNYWDYFNDRMSEHQWYYKNIDTGEYWKGWLEYEGNKYYLLYNDTINAPMGIALNTRPLYKDMAEDFTDDNYKYGINNSVYFADTKGMGKDGCPSFERGTDGYYRLNENGDREYFYLPTGALITDAIVYHVLNDRRDMYGIYYDERGKSVEIGELIYLEEKYMNKR